MHACCAQARRACGSVCTAGLHARLQRGCGSRACCSANPAALPLALQVVPGELTVVTGLPNSGKSEWIDALAVNLARHHGWRIGLCSLENSAKEHGRKLMEKYTGEGGGSSSSSRVRCAVEP